MTIERIGTRGRDEGLHRAAEHPAPVRRRSRERPSASGVESRHRLGARNEPRRRARRGDRLRHRAAVRGRGARRVHDADPDEEEPPRRAAERDLPTRTTVAELEAILFRETATFGVRRYPAERSKLQREAVTVETPWGPVRAKRGWRDDGFEVVTPEYEDCARVAREHGVPLRDVYDAVTRQAARRSRVAGTM